ncbi:BA14K family protein [Roseibium sp. RKSG952]|nr:BA14K family protein [Roseibium sp. RKSG952]
MAWTSGSTAADLSARQPAPPPRVIYVEPVQPKAYLPPAYNSPGPRWQSGYYGHGWKRYNGWWFPPEGFTFNTVPPRYAPPIPYAPGLTLEAPAGETTVVETEVVTVAPAPAPVPALAAPVPLAGELRVKHVNWCLGKYRSYLVADNTYQPFEGPRTICRSPYWRG